MTPKESSLRVKRILKKIVMVAIALAIMTAAWFASKAYYTGKSFKIHVPANAIIYHDYVGTNFEDPVDHNQVFFFYEKVDIFMEEKLPDMQDLLNKRDFFPFELTATGFKQLSNGSVLYYVESINGAKYVIKY